MQTPPFFQKFGRDIIYITLIGCMVGWIWKKEKRESVWNQILCTALEESIQHIEKQNETKTQLIKKYSYDYPCESNEKIKGRVIQIQKSVTDFRNKIEKAMVGLGSDSIKTIRLFEKLQISAQVLCDLLIISVDKDSLSAAKLKALLEQEPSSQFWAIAKNSDSSQARVVLKILSEKSGLAVALVFDFWGQRISGNDDFRFISYEPMSNPDSAAIYVGSTYHTDIFLAPYFSNTRNFSVQVNEKPLPFKNGFAHFSQQYTSPGPKKYTVKMELKNPLTGVVNVFVKEFGLIVVDSCR